MCETIVNQKRKNIYLRTRKADVELKDISFFVIVS